jgi:uncharacterized protein (TIGR02466 family)
MEADVKKQLLFAIPLYQKQLPRFAEKQAETIKTILAMRDGCVGIARSNAGGWHSTDDLHKSENPEIAWIMQRALQIAESCIVEYYGESKQGQLHMVNAWANINGPGNWNAPHIHLPCQWSGCFYVNVNDAAQLRNDGNIIFIDPLPLGPHFRKATNSVIQPKTGMILIFPSYLMHMVEPHQSDEERISIAFNLQWVDKKAMASRG